MRTPRKRKPPNRYHPDSPDKVTFDLDDSDFPPLTSPLAQSTQKSTQSQQEIVDATFLRISTVTDENNNVSVVQDESSQSSVISKGCLVFAKTGTKPYWPAKVLTINDGKVQVFLFGLKQTAEVPREKITLVKDESKARY